jgi:hypothetical protein
MNQLTRTAIALVFFALAGGAAADKSPPGPSVDGSVDWSQTHLSPEPALQQQFTRTRAFFDDKVPDIDAQISQLKSAGILDRRSATKLRSALDNARVSITRMAGDMRDIEHVDGRTARMFAFELGMAADTLTRQAGKIETNLQAATGSSDGLPDGQSPDREQQRQLGQALNETSDLLRETAGAVMDNLNKAISGNRLRRQAASRENNRRALAVVISSTRSGEIPLTSAMKSRE